MKNFAILSSHNGSGFEALYNGLHGKEIDIKLVISNNTDAGVLQKAQNKNLPHYIVNAKRFENPDEEIYRLLKEANCEYIFLSGYMKKVSDKLLSEFKVVNSHPSLLPNYGGKGMYGRLVHEAVVANNERISGVTIHQVDENYDEGPIILQKELQVAQGESVDSLEERVKELEKTAIVEGVSLFIKQ